MARLRQCSRLFRVALPVVILARACRMSLQFPHLSPGSPSRWLSDSSCRANVTISGVGFVYQIRARRYDKRPHLPGDVAVVESRCGNNQFGRTRDRSIGRGEQHFSNHPGFLWGSGGHLEHYGYRWGNTSRSDCSHCEPRQSDDNGDRPDSTTHRDRDL